jgi:hypothetical protein
MERTVRDRDSKRRALAAELRDSDAYTNSNSHAYTNSYPDTDAYADTNSHAHTDTQPNANGNAYPDA